jgi:peptidase E
VHIPTHHLRVEICYTLTMTKYILHGGNTKEDNEENNAFFKEMTSGQSDQINILLCYFARADEEINECAKQDKDKFIKESENKNLIFEVLDSEKLADQVKKADVIYFRGGNTAKLKEKLSQTSNLEELLKDKVVGGSSAGVYVFTRFFWENDTEEFMEGLGFLNLKAFCHYTEEHSDRRDQLLNHGENLPLLILPNYKWVIFFK